MSFQRLAFGFLIACFLPGVTLAQAAPDAPARLHLELNALGDVEGGCRLSFLARNEIGAEIAKAVFETVIFDSAGGVASLSLFDFRDLPANRPRVRQFDVQGMTCDAVGQVLINGASSCVVDGIESEICGKSLSLDSRIEVELLG